MKNIAILLGLLLGWAHTAYSAEVLIGDAASGEALATTCSACHGADGNSPSPAFPKLAGLGEKYLLKQMKDIRDGARSVPTMAGQVDNKTDQELADIAAYFASWTASIPAILRM